MKLHRFNDEGVRRFHQYLDALAVDRSLVAPVDLLHDASCAEQLSPEIELGDPHFANRMEAGKYLDDMLSRVEGRDVRRDVGLWAWLTLRFFNQVCPLDSTGKRKKVGERTTYIPRVDDYQKYYRHRLLGPYVIYRAHRDHPERAMALLFQDVAIHPDIAEQIFGYQELAVSRGVVALASRLYFDPGNQKLRRGVGSKTKGGARRLSDMMNQLGLTWDLQFISDEELAPLLPGEFDRFRASP